MLNLLLTSDQLAANNEALELRARKAERAYELLECALDDLTDADAWREMFGTREVSIYEVSAQIRDRVIAARRDAVRVCHICSEGAAAGPLQDGYCGRQGAYYHPRCAEQQAIIEERESEIRMAS